MWLKILQGVVTVAKATGLDKKVKSWVLKRLGKAEQKVIDAAEVKLRKIEALYETVGEDPLREDLCD